MAEKPHQRCPFESCGSSDAFSYNTELKVGKCHSCGEAYPNKNKSIFDWALEEYPVPEQKSKQKREIAHTTYDGIRGLDSDVAKFYGIQLQLDADGEPVQYAFKYPTNVKYLDVKRPDGNKTIWFKNRGVKCTDLFGPQFNAGSSKRLYITEGEFDAASLYQVLGKTYPVMSVPSSSIGTDFFKKNHDYLSRFEEIVYAGELDKAGKPCAEKFYTAYPEKLWFVSMTKWKDANEFLTEGDGDDLKWSALKPQRYSPDNFFCSSGEFETILREENPYEAVPVGHSGIDYMTRGLVRGGVTFVKAPPGTGKTEIIRYFEHAMLATDDIRIAAIHMEEMKSTTLRCMGTYELGVNVRTKEDALENGISEEDVIKASLAAAKGERTILFEMRSEDDPSKILDYVSLAARIYGADFVFIDHVQRLTYLSGTDGATNTLTKIAANLAQISKELNIGVIVISHVNEDGHTKYAKSLEEEAIICLKIDRDKEAEDETTKNTTQFYVEKNRPFSRIGPAGSVLYNPETTLIEEISYEL